MPFRPYSLRICNEKIAGIGTLLGEKHVSLEKGRTNKESLGSTLALRAVWQNSLAGSFLDGSLAAVLLAMKGPPLFACETLLSNAVGWHATVLRCLPPRLALAAVVSCLCRCPSFCGG